MLLLSRCSLRRRSEKYTRLCGSAYRYWSLWIPRLCHQTGMNVRWTLERPLQIAEKETRRTNAYLLPRIAEWVPLVPHIDLRTSLAQLRYVLRLQGSRLASTCFVLQMFARFCKVHITRCAHQSVSKLSKERRLLDAFGFFGLSGKTLIRCTNWPIQTCSRRSKTEAPSRVAARHQRTFTWAQVETHCTSLNILKLWTSVNKGRQGRCVNEKTTNIITSAKMTATCGRRSASIAKSNLSNVTNIIPPKHKNITQSHSTDESSRSSLKIPFESTGYQSILDCPWLNPPFHSLPNFPAWPSDIDATRGWSSVAPDWWIAANREDRHEMSENIANARWCTSRCHWDRKLQRLTIYGKWQYSYYSTTTGHREAAGNKFPVKVGMYMSV